MPFTAGSYSKTKTFANSGSILPADLNSIQDDIGGQLNTAMIKSGVSDATVIRRGTSIIATEEARTSTSYGTLTTPDRVSSIVLPTDGLLYIAFQGEWKESVDNAANAAIFIGANQLKYNFGNTQGSQAAKLDGNAANVYRPLCSSFRGLEPHNDQTLISTFGAFSGDVTTGELVGNSETDASYGFYGGPACIFAAAGTYDITIQYKSTSGSVTAKNRKLWVWTMGF